MDRAHDRIDSRRSIVRSGHVLEAVADQSGGRFKLRSRDRLIPLLASAPWLPAQFIPALRRPWRTLRRVVRHMAIAGARLVLARAIRCGNRFGRRRLGRSRCTPHSGTFLHVHVGNGAIEFAAVPTTHIAAAVATAVGIVVRPATTTAISATTLIAAGLAGPVTATITRIAQVGLVTEFTPISRAAIAMMATREEPIDDPAVETRTARTAAAAIVVARATVAVRTGVVAAHAMAQPATARAGSEDRGNHGGD